MGLQYHKITVDSPLGELTVLGDAQAIVGVYMQGQTHLPAYLEEIPQGASMDTLNMAAQWLQDYFSGACPPCSRIPLRPQGTPFQQEVWRRLMRIPYGNTVTYGQLAEELAQLHNVPFMSAQAVGGAVGRNPISIIIPCHRVLGVNGAITGYAGGIVRKKWLLEHEGIRK